jgi:hypothetical protein
MVSSEGLKGTEVTETKELYVPLIVQQSNRPRRKNESTEGSR